MADASRRTEVEEGRNKLGRLEATGRRVGDAADFLQMSAEEAACVEIKMALGDVRRLDSNCQKASQGALIESLTVTPQEVRGLNRGDAPAAAGALSSEAMIAARNGAS